MNPYISIIIPVYNTANYVARTLDSILKQDFRDYEIILLDDGSKDSSANICKQYAETYSCINFIVKENEGVAKTRNIALDIAQGEYIFFIDSDDIIYQNSLEKVIAILKNIQPDFLRYDFNTIDVNDQNLYPNHLRKRRKKYHGKILKATDFMQKIMKNEYYLCMNVFKQSIIKQYNIKFLNGCTCNEDTLFIIQYLQYCQKCIYTDILLYGYRKYDGAVTAHFTTKHYSDVKRVYWELYLLAGNSDIRMRKSIMKVAGRLALHLHKYVLVHHYVDNEYLEIENNCKRNALPIEWFFKRWLPNKPCSVVWKLISITKKIKYRL